MKLKLQLGVEVVVEVRVQLLAVVAGWVGGQVLYSTQLKLKLKFELSLAILEMVVS